MKRAYYSSTTENFILDSADSILGKLTKNHEFALEDLQRNAWLSQIEILKNSVFDLPESFIAFEYSIPRMGKRIDVILLYKGIVFALEFKVGETKYIRSASEQCLDYAIDLKNFHQQSHDRAIVPVVMATNANSIDLTISSYSDRVFSPINCTQDNLASYIELISAEINEKNPLDPDDWINSIYKPTPTIIEAAQALYKGHSVKEISRSDSGAINLDQTSSTISEIIQSSKQRNKKSICFITGVPGSGKTLAGLNIANENHNIATGEHAVFLSGNGPLVEVLQEALAKNEVAESKATKNKLKKSDSLRKTKTFIQNIHHFRDDALKNSDAPIEHIVIFDEAQRAWTQEQTSSFMLRKKGKAGFNMSEPEFLIGVLDRHQDWATIICLIGGGQEINTGEAGLPEWFSAIGKNYMYWDVYVSDKLTEKEYTNGKYIYGTLSNNPPMGKNELHLSVSVRSYRSEKLSAFVKAFLDNNLEEARKVYRQIKDNYPIVLSRDINNARSWLRGKSRGSESIGVTASSGAYRLKPYGLHVKAGIDVKAWFLNDKNDVRSAGFLEDVATEFDIQGLELDWTCIAWDADLRKIKDGWESKKFRGTKWMNINNDNNKRYLLNAYRVLLTRARQGMVIFIPKGDKLDATRQPEFYDPVFDYFINCGIPTIDET